MSTQFCSTEVQLPSIDGAPSLIIDGNSKVSGWQPRPNALSLPAPETCPGATDTCRVACYASTAETKIPPELAAQYRHNLTTLRRVLAGPTSRQWDAAMALGRWIAANCGPGSADGGGQLGFRWHVSGDVFDEHYAQWIDFVCLASPAVQHWIYTRSLGIVRRLTRIQNLAVNVSADADNYALAAWARYTGQWRNARVCGKTRVRMTYLWRGEQLPWLPPGSIVFPDYGQRHPDVAARKGLPGGPLPPPPWRAMICPADYYGQSERLRCGVCTKCGNPRHRV